MKCEPTFINASSFAVNVSTRAFSFAVNLSQKDRQMRARQASNAKLMGSVLGAVIEVNVAIS